MMSYLHLQLYIPGWRVLVYCAFSERVKKARIILPHYPYFITHLTQAITATLATSSQVHSSPCTRHSPRSRSRSRTYLNYVSIKPTLTRTHNPVPCEVVSSRYVTSHPISFPPTHRKILEIFPSHVSKNSLEEETCLFLPLFPYSSIRASFVSCFMFGTFTQSCPFIQSFSHSAIRSFIHSFIHHSQPLSISVSPRST